MKATTQGRRAHFSSVFRQCPQDRDTADAVFGSSSTVFRTTTIPTIVGAELCALDKRRKPSIWNVEQFDSRSLMERIGPSGLPWQVIKLDDSARVSL